MTATAALAIPTLTARAAEINNDHRMALAASKSMLHFALHAGENLLKVKGMVPHGSFGDWCRENLTFSERMARKYMRLAKTAPQGQFDPEASINAALDAIADRKVEQQPGGTLDPSTAEKIVKLARMANSENENEASVAQEMIDRLGKKFGLTGEEAEVAAKKLCPEPPSHDDLVQRADEFSARISARLDAIRDEVRAILTSHSRDDAAEQLAKIICVLKFPKEFRNA